MTGKLIFVSGLSGSGKTTLIGGALRLMPELVYLKTYTTRPMRAGEQGSHEYVFVDQLEYDKLRATSKHWDHTEYGGFMYGADVAVTRGLLTASKTVICSVAPEMDVIASMTDIYGPATTVWIKVPKDIAKQRVYDDDIRDSRSEDFAMGNNFDVIFEPIGQIEPDVKNFASLISGILSHDEMNS